MNGIKHELGLRLIKSFNVLLMTFPIILCWFLYYVNIGHNNHGIYSHLFILVLFDFLFIYVGKAYDAFLVSLVRISEMFYSQTLSLLISDGVMYIVLCLLDDFFVNPVPLLIVFAIQLVCSLLWCLFTHKLYFKIFHAKPSAIIYQKRQGLEDLVEEYGLAKKFNVIAVYNIDDITDDIDKLNSVKVVFLSGVSSHNRNLILKYCIENKITSYVIPNVGDLIMSSAKNMHMFHLPMLRIDRYNPSPFFLFFKRVFDIVVSVIGLIVLSPVFVILALLIKKEDGGPVFYKQERLTRNGKHFLIHKFRSMCVDAEKDGIARLSSGDNDERITKVGRFMRKVRLDELPQLIDILKGDLSIVGPRPERPEIAEEYELEIPEFRLRLQAKAGLTGYAQVYGKYNSEPYDKLKMDLIYIAHPGLLEDFRIMLATVKILFLPDSTEGVVDGQTNALIMNTEEDKK